MLFAISVSVSGRQLAPRAVPMDNCALNRGEGEAVWLESRLLNDGWLPWPSSIGDNTRSAESGEQKINSQGDAEGIRQFRRAVADGLKER